MEDASGSAMSVDGHGTVPPASSWVPSLWSSSGRPPDCAVEKVYAKARWLIRMLAWVRATLDDAEDMDITEWSVRSWLRELQAVSDAGEDVLDEFPHHEVQPAAAAPPRQGGERMSEMTMLEQRIEQVVSRFMGIEKPEQAQLLPYDDKGELHVEMKSPGRASSFTVQEQRIFGREKDLERVKLFLLPSNSEECGGNDGPDDDDDVDVVPVMSIVGMGGLGKTTLAQLAYNDDQVHQHFQLKSWVCVSEDFDVVRLTKAMLQSLNVEASGFSQLDPLQRKLVQRLGGAESFLLVLDDVWDAENLNSSSWNLLTAPLRNTSAKTKIVVTSRNRRVSEMVAGTITYDLCFLSHEHSLDLFKQHAFQSRDPNLHPNLVAIGKEIARKCRGVPLAAKTLGGLLCNKDDAEWKKIFESKLWDATINQENSIIPILRLGYGHLPAHLKRCFRYCSLFPKGYEFDRVQIVHKWMAHSYIKANRKELMEDVGQRYVDDLLSRSFFQRSQNSKKFHVHDLMHELARSVSQDECYSVEDGKSYLSSRHVRHVSITTWDHNRFFRSFSMPTVDRSQPLSFRSFSLAGSKFLACPFECRQICDFCTRMEHLRVLDLHGISLHVLPEFLTRLKHLRFLHIKNVFQKLPESVGNLYHLQFLEFVVPDKLLRLPNCITNLLNLRHLIYNKNTSSVEYPVGFGKLTALQTMPGFCVGPKQDCAKLGEVKDMNIRGGFSITGLHNLADVNEAKKACLDKKRNICYLHLEWNYKANSSSVDHEVLESLKPSPKLANLCISGFKGQSYPSWLGHRSFYKLGTVKLEKCVHLTSLPPLGQLPALKSLSISRAGGVEHIGKEFFFGGFPQLEELTLENMYNWKSWCGAQKGECSKLEKLCITQCGNLESLTLVNLGAVRVLNISFCCKLQFSSGSLQLSHLPSMHQINIEKVYRVGHIRVDFSTLENPQCLELKDVGQQEAEYVLAACSHIGKLTVTSCPTLISLPLINLSALKYVEIIECEQFRISSFSVQLRQLPSLHSICIQCVHGAEYIYGSFSPGSRKTLKISSLELRNVYQLEPFFLLNGFSHIRQLVVTRCTNLRFLPLKKLTTLEYLKISQCPLFQLFDAENLPPRLKVLCIFGNPCRTEQCCKHHHFQRLKQVQQSKKGGGVGSLYLLFRNVHNAIEAANFCSDQYPGIHTLEMEWDCCANHSSNDVDAVAEEFLRKLSYANFSQDVCLQKLVIRGYTGSRFASWPWNSFSDKEQFQFFSSCLSSVTLLQCSKFETLQPLSQLPSLKELYVEGASRLETVVGHSEKETNTNIAFPSLQKLEFQKVCVWKEWLGTKEGDFPSLSRLILKHCPRLRALPHLPPTLSELEVEGCEELKTLPSSGSFHSRGLKTLKSLKRLSLTDCPKLYLSATESPPNQLQYMSVTRCPLLLTSCGGDSKVLEHTPNISVDGVQVSTRKRYSSNKSRINKKR